MAEEVVWVEVPDFVKLARKLVEVWQDHIGHVDVSDIVAFAKSNKDRKPGQPVVDIKAIKPPESLISRKKYVVRLHSRDWDVANDQLREWMVFSALERIDPDKPDTIKPLDQKDRFIMVKAGGPEWFMRGDLPSLSNREIEFDSSEGDENESEMED